jgi:hypothetical protein
VLLPKGTRWQSSYQAGSAVGLVNVEAKSLDACMPLDVKAHRVQNVENESLCSLQYADACTMNAHNTCIYHDYHVNSSVRIRIYRGHPSQHLEVEVTKKKDRRPAGG